MGAMRHYEDRSKKSQVIEQNFNFAENGGYYIELYYKPRNRFWSILHKLGIIKAKTPIAEIEQMPTDWEYLNFQPENGLKSRSIFLTTRGRKTLRFFFPDETAKKYRIKIFIEKLYN
jgi:hypothetical protein